MKVTSGAAKCFIILLIQIFSQVLADYERSCAISDYRSRADPYALCGRMLAEMLQVMCASEGLGRRRKRNVFLTNDAANSYLRTKRSMNSGIVCECCINACGVEELSQYCQYKRKKRSIKSLLTEGDLESKHITQQDVNEIYKKIKIESESVEEKVPISREEYKKMLILEENKRANIEKKKINLEEALLEAKSTKQYSSETIADNSKLTQKSTLPKIISPQDVESPRSLVNTRPHRHRHKHMKRHHKF